MVKGYSLQRDRAGPQTADIYPTYGLHLNGGFLSHVAGKVFVRTGHDGVGLRIHNAFSGRPARSRPGRVDGPAAVSPARAQLGKLPRKPSLPPRAGVLPQGVQTRAAGGRGGR